MFPTDAKYTESSFSALERVVDSLLANSYDEISVASFIKKHLLQGCEITVQSCKTKEDLYKRDAYFAKIRRYNSSNIEWSVFTGILGQMLTARVPNCTSPEALRQNETTPGSLVSSVVRHNIMGECYQPYVSHLLEVEGGTAKAFHQSLGDTVLVSLHAKDTEKEASLGAFRGWFAPDVDSFDRRCPRECAYVTYMVAMRLLGWT